MIGTLGDTAFQASAESVLTWQSASRSTTARYTTHQPLGQAPVTERLGPGLSTIQMQIRLDRQMGIDPEAELTTLQEAQSGGDVLELMVGDKPIGDYVITQLEEQWREVISDGTRLVLGVALTLEEYGG
jgi:phage protein U